MNKLMAVNKRTAPKHSKSSVELQRLIASGERER